MTTKENASRIEEAVVAAAADPILGKMLEEERVEAAAFDVTLLWRLFGYVRPHKALAVTTVVLATIESLMMAVPAYVIGLTIDHISHNRRELGVVGELLLNLGDWAVPPGGEGAAGDLVLFFGGLIAALWCARWAVGSGSSFLVRKLGQEIVHDLRMEVHRHIITMDATFFEKNPVGRLVNRTTFDVATLSDLFSDAFAQGLRDTAFVLVLLSVMLGMDVPLGSVIVLSLPVLVAVVLAYRHFGRPALRSTSAVVSRMNAWLAENLAGMRENQLYRVEDQRRAEFEALTRAHQTAITRVLQAWGLLRPAMMLTTGVATSLVLFIGHARVTEGLVSVGVLLTFLQYVVQVWRPIRNLSDKFNLVQTALTSGERVFDILDAQPEMVDNPGADSGGSIARGSITFDSVTFRYPRSAGDVLRAISFEAKPGQMVALVGDTGAGKSTIVRLLSRFYDATSGVVRVDDRDVRDYPLATLRSALALVPQEVTIFAGSMRDNIALGREVSDARIIECLRAVRAETLLSNLDGGLDHEFEEAGRTLSTGERQLLSFARALVINPPVLILDEATANVDTQTELRIQEALTAMTTGRTSLVIAHRLSTIRHADLILVLRDGQIVERGDHETLLAMGGEYARLHETHYGSVDDVKDR